jgi:hypothetical protein
LDENVPIEAEPLFVERIKKKYEGKWIAVKGKNVVVVLDSHDEVIKELEKKELDNVYVFYSPLPEEKGYEFLFLV